MTLLEGVKSYSDPSYTYFQGRSRPQLHMNYAPVSINSIVVFCNVDWCTVFLKFFLLNDTVIILVLIIIVVGSLNKCDTIILIAGVWSFSGCAEFGVRFPMGSSYRSTSTLGWAVLLWVRNDYSRITKWCVGLRLRVASDEQSIAVSDQRNEWWNDNETGE